MYGFARRIENTQCANRGKFEVFSISPYEKMASPERSVLVPYIGIALSTGSAEGGHDAGSEASSTCSFHKIHNQLNVTNTIKSDSVQFCTAD